MSKETGITCLVYVGDGGLDSAGAARSVTAATYGLSNSSGIITITESSGSLITDGAVVGGLVHVSGFAEVGNTFRAVITAATESSITVKSPVSPETGNAVIPVTEAASESVTLTFEHFNIVGGQDDSGFDKSASEIDTSSKDSGGWGSSLAGTRQLSVNCSGTVTWPDVAGWQRLNDAMDAGARVNTRLVLNSANDAYYVPMSITSQTGGGSRDSANAYAFTLNNTQPPVLLRAA